MLGFRLRAVCLLLAFSLILSPMASTVSAGSFFTPRRTFGALFLGSSIFMAKKSWDFHNDANDIYDSYKLAGNSDQADKFYDRASDRDTKSQMSLGISLALLAGGLRLLLSSGVDDNVPKHREKLNIEMTRNPRTGSVGLAFTKGF